jgi:hypothetical protein
MDVIHPFCTNFRLTKEDTTFTRNMLKRSRSDEMESEETSRCIEARRTLVTVKSGPHIMSRAVVSDGRPFTFCTPALFMTSTLSDDSDESEAEAPSESSTPSPSDSPALVYAPSSIGCANSKRMQSLHKMDNERAAVKESKLWDHLWDKLPLTLRQEDIAWFVGTSLSEDDCASLDEGEGAFDDAEGDDECHH